MLRVVYDIHMIRATVIFRHNNKLIKFEKPEINSEPMRLSYRAQWTVGNFLICAVSMTEQID
jgi:hypothetical protein